MNRTVLQRPWMAFALAIFSMTFLSGCKVVGAIFKTGLGVGVFITVLLVALVGGVAAVVRK